jgi:hypothetical protein
MMDTEEARLLAAIDRARAAILDEAPPEEQTSGLSPADVAEDAASSAPRFTYRHIEGEAPACESLPSGTFIFYTLSSVYIRRPGETIFEVYAREVR